MLKPKYMVAGVVSFQMHLHAENLIVAHSHEIPSRLMWLCIIRGIPGAAPDLPASNQISHGQIEGPPDPTPVHAIWRRVLFLVQRCQSPVQSLVGADFDTRDAATAARVGVTCDWEALVNILHQRERLIVVRLAHDRVDVELIEYVLGFVEPPTLYGLFRRNVRRQDTVVMIVIMVSCLMLENVYLGQPLNK